MILVMSRTVSISKSDVPPANVATQGRKSQSGTRRPGRYSFTTDRGVTIPPDQTEKEKPIVAIDLCRADSVNDALNADLDGGLSKLASIGLRFVEAFDFVRRPTELARHWIAMGSRTTGHAFLVSEEIRRRDGTVTPVPPHQETFAAARELGLRRSWIPSSPLRSGHRSIASKKRQPG